MRKQLYQNRNNKTGEHTMHAIFALSFMLASLIGHTQTAYITNSGDGTVSVVNVATNTVTDTIHLPHLFCVAASPDGSKIYVGSGEAILTSVIVCVINTATNTISDTISVGGSDHDGIAVSLDGSKIYVTNAHANTVSIVNVTNHAVSPPIGVGTYPIGIAVTPDDSILYVANNLSNTISVVNATTDSVIATIPVGNGPMGVSISLDGSKVYVTNNGDSTVSVINCATNTVSTTIQVGSNPCGISVNPDGSSVYVANNNDSSVSVINSATNIVSNLIAVGNRPTGVSVTPDGSKVYVTNYYDNTVSVINTVANTVSATIPVGKYPTSFGNFISIHQVAGITSVGLETINISIYPNPFTSQTTIAFSEEQKNTTITITNVLGKEIRAQCFTGKQVTIEKGEMSNGIYFVQITDDQKNVVNKKIIIQ